MAAAAEEAIIRNRLLADERGLRRCVIKSRALAGVTDAAIRAELQEDLLVELALYESSVIKAQLVADMCDRQMAIYEQDQADIEEQVVETQRMIATLKATLELHQQDRLNRLEYDEIADKILKLPSKEDSVRESERVQVSIAEMEADHRALEDSLASRSARFVELHKSLATLSAASKPL